MTGVDYKDPQTLAYANDAGDNGTIQIPLKFLGLAGTTYIYRGIHDPTASDLVSCGHRCVWMWAYKNPYPSGFVPPPEPPAFYRCPVNISEVQNSSLPEHDIPDGVVKLAAASIALHGQYVGSVDDYSKQDYESYQFNATG